MPCVGGVDSILLAGISVQVLIFEACESQWPKILRRTFKSYRCFALASPPCSFLELLDARPTKRSISYHFLKEWCVYMGILLASFFASTMFKKCKDNWWRPHVASIGALCVCFTSFEETTNYPRSRKTEWKHVTISGPYLGLDFVMARLVTSDHCRCTKSG